MIRRAGIIGHPVAHSLSPAFQQAAFEHCGLDISYTLWDTAPGDLPKRLEVIRDPIYVGGNVTIPHKEAVIPLLDELGDRSMRVGAVNTIVNRSGRLFGFNTDGQGFVSALRNEAGFEPARCSMLLLGAGGAARGIAFALAEARAGRVAIANRSPGRAERLAEDVSQGSPAEVDAVAWGEGLGEYDCIVNCTSVGMDGGGAAEQAPISLEGAKPGALVVDIVYVPEGTPLLAAARAGGHPVLGGLPMLIYQGALAFELWTGVDAPIEVMFAAARKELAEREARAVRP
jgi:shikimate dehydrogenase